MHRKITVHAYPTHILKYLKMKKGAFLLQVSTKFRSGGTIKLRKVNTPKKKK
ncbi:hypothetical protein FORC47_p406 (plasmid) [Bacillus cereus]|nr:hypothetical protein FORC47_p406 [Bacillus cereus]